MKSLYAPHPSFQTCTYQANRIIVPRIRCRRSTVCFAYPHAVVANGRSRILRIPFTGSVKLRALLLKAGPGDKTPAKVSLVCRTIDYAGVGRDEKPQFANENNIDFDDIADKTPTQEFNVPQGREIGEYQVRYTPHKPCFLTWVSQGSPGLRNSRIFLP